MNLVVINSIGPMGSSVVSSILDHLNYISIVGCRKRKLNKYVSGEYSIDNKFFKEKTNFIAKEFSKKIIMGGVSILDRDSSQASEKLNYQIIEKDLDYFNHHTYKNISDMYFDSMKILNKSLIYKKPLTNIQGAVELTTDIHNYDYQYIYSKYKESFDNVFFINLNRDFDQWMNSKCSQIFAKKISLRYLLLTLNSQYKLYYKYNCFIGNSNELSINFNEIFIPNTKSTINKISNYINSKNENLDWHKLNYDLYGKICNYEKAFTKVDDNINYLSKITLKICNSYYKVKNKNFFIMVLFSIPFQLMYLIDLIRYKLRYGTYKLK